MKMINMIKEKGVWSFLENHPMTHNSLVVLGSKNANAAPAGTMMRLAGGCLSKKSTHRVLNSRERQARAALLKEYYFQQSGQYVYLISAYPDAYRQPSYDMSTTTWSDSSSAAEEDDENPLVTTKILPDPCPTVNPKSQKMALGSITFSGEQGIPLGVMTKDNSFFLRVEKCHPEFCGLLNYEIEKMHNFSCPYDAEDKTEYWPEGALNNYCQNMNPDLWAAMTKVYRNWHDTRSGMESLCARLTQLKEKRAARYGKD
eukprot:g15967.t1